MQSVSNLYKLLLLTLLVSVLSVPASFAANLNIWNDTSLTITDLSGPGQDRSSLTNGSRYYNHLDIRSRGQMESYEYSLTLGLKATDDPRRDSEKFSLTNVNGRLSNGIHTLNVGDTYESFSKYALNTAIKGASYRYQDDSSNLPEITMLGGIAYSRWDNFWDTDATERKIYGARVRQNILPELWVAASSIVIEDHLRNFGSPLYDGNTFTLDFEYHPLPGLTVIGESSFSHVNEDSEITGSVKQKGKAYRLQAIGDEDPSRVVLEYERVSPDYLSIAGSATPDREKFKADWRYRHSMNLTIYSAFLWYRDDLHNQLPARTHHYKPEVKATLQQLFGRRYAVTSLGYKMDRSYSSAISIVNHFATLGYRDRFGIFDSNSNFGVIFYDTKTQRDNDEFIANTSLSTRISRDNVIWKPSVTLGTWRSENELTDETDNIYEYTLGLGCEIPSLQVTSELKIGQHRLLKESADDATRLHATLNIYYRPPLFAGLKNSTIYLRGLVNDYEHSTSSRDFREKSLVAGVSVRY